MRKIYFKISIVFFLDDFFQREIGMCGSKENLNGNYNSIQVAKIECNKDNHCVGIQEKKGTFQPCRNGVKKPPKGRVYIHEKQVVTGMSLFIFSCLNVN